MAPSARGRGSAITAAASGRVFISYRRQESSDIAGRLYDRLAGHLGEGQVFMDVDTIALGVDFAEVITQAVSTCEVLLAVIGPQWLTATNQRGDRRLEDPDDIVVLEIAAALERDIRVIPILVAGAQMPRRQELPENLAGLARRNALSLRHESFRSDADRLLAAIEPIVRPSASEGQGSSGSVRAAAPPTKAIDNDLTATASRAESTTPVSDRLDTGWSGAQVHKFEHPSSWGLIGSKPVFGVAISPNGRWLATGSEDKTARIWDAHSGQQLRALRHGNRVYSVAFSPDGRWLATGGDDKKARICDAQSGELLQALRHEHQVRAVAFSPDGRWLATGSHDKTARIWDARSGQQLDGLSHVGEVRAVAFSPDGRLLATGSEDKKARIWDAQSGQQLHALRHDHQVRAVAFSPDGRLLATGSLDRTARIWDWHSGQLHALRDDHQVWAVAFSPDGHWLATGTGGNRAVLWILKPL
jgi:dipeptidyl aminopeptidase/acylaminoacyl peptidase